MNDELFPIPASEPDRLTVARRRYEEACTALERADWAQDEYGDPVPPRLVQEHKEAQKGLHRAEQAELKSAGKIERNAGAAD